jgi:4'-phosphopantetheinyl transferase
MAVYLLNLHTLCENDVKTLFCTLPSFRAESAKRYRRREAYVQAVAGFCLVRYALKQLDPSINTDEWAFAENGKPYLREGTPFFNLSHTAHCVAVAVSEHEELGIDIEEIKPHAAGFAEKFCSEAECALIRSAADPTSELIRLWSAKEALAKQSGKGIGTGMRALSASTAQSLPLSVDGIPHWLSVAPAEAIPCVTWVNKDDLLCI